MSCSRSNQELRHSRPLSQPRSDYETIVDNWIESIIRKQCQLVENRPLVEVKGDSARRISWGKIAYSAYVASIIVSLDD